MKTKKIASMVERLSTKKSLGDNDVLLLHILNTSQRTATVAGKPKTKHSTEQKAQAYTLDLTPSHQEKSNFSHTNSDAAELLDTRLY